MRGSESASSRMNAGSPVRATQPVSPSSSANSTLPTTWRVDPRGGAHAQALAVAQVDEAGVAVGRLGDQLDDAVEHPRQVDRRADRADDRVQRVALEPYALELCREVAAAGHAIDPTARMYPTVHEFARNGGLEPHCPVRAPLDRTIATPGWRGIGGCREGTGCCRSSSPRSSRSTEAAPAQSLTQDSAVLGEQFYFFTVVLMWLIHAGFMSYEAGVARRKNVMATAMKNILTIAVVTPTFYYFGWWVYNCNQAGPADRPQLLGLHLGRLPGRHPVERRLRAEPDEQHQPDLLPGLPALLVDDGLDPVGRDHRAGAHLGLPRARRAPGLGRVDPRRRVGLERRRLADAALRVPRLDRLGGGARRRGSVHLGRALQRRARE